jgi:hypothetical protein
MQDILVKLNSHKAGIVGILVFVAGLSTDPNVNGLIHLFPAATASAIQADLSKAAEIAGFILGYLGRPKTV